jgi:hypothetical protein
MRSRVAWLELGGVLGIGVVAAGLWVGVSAALGRGAPAAASTTAAPTDLETALKKAQANGKYRMLLRQFKVAKDAETYQDFKDLGYREMAEYAGFKDLPAGHWVYVAPYWYIWRDLTSVQRPKRNWGPEQATGEPDTNMAGDIVTAWASQSQDNQEEWLMTEYDDFVSPTAVMVYETYNPGALYRVTAFKPDGEEVELWKGTDPTPTDAGIGVSEIPVKVTFKTNRVKIYIDSPSVPGWNEIDAVGLRDKNKTMHWAVAAEASSTYAAPYPTEAQLQAQAEAELREASRLNIASRRELMDAQDRIKKLEDEVRQLKDVVEQLKKDKEKGK